MTEETLFKLTTRDGYTRKGYNNALLWEVGKSHEITWPGNRLCTGDVIHAYTGVALALLLNPIHAGILNPRLFECRGAVVATDNGLKVGVKKLTVVRELPVPKVTNRQHVIFAILCAQDAQDATKHLFNGDSPWQVLYREKMAVWSDWAAKYLANDPAAAAARYAAAYAHYTDIGADKAAPAQFAALIRATAEAAFSERLAQIAERALSEF